jgi:hypothetical protein
MKNPSSEDLEKLAFNAKEIAKKVAACQDWEPLVVEFAGTPKSGKSTNIEVLNHFLRRSGFKVAASTEGVSKRTPYNLKADLMAYNSWALCYAISELLVGYYNVDKPHVVMLDRGPFDSLAWMRHLREDGKLSNEEYTIIYHFVTIDKWEKIVKRIYLFTCDPKLSLKRELEEKLIRASGLVMNEERLIQLKEQYDILKEDLNSESKLYHIDTTDTESPIETAFELANDLLRIMESQLNER